MTKEKKINVAKALTAQLHTAEEAIDTALSESANLIETCISARRAVHLSTVAGNDVHHNTLKAMTALAEAQTYMSAAHASLATIKDNMGISAFIPPVLDKTVAQVSDAISTQELTPIAA